MLKLKIHLYGTRFLLAFLLLSVAPLQGSLLGGTVITPSVYRVTIKRMEFQRKDGSYYLFADGMFSFDLASVGQGQAAGSFAEGKSLRPGSYLGVRLTFSRDFGLVAEGNHLGQRLRSEGGNPSNLAHGGLTQVSAATVDALPAAYQIVPLPQGGLMTQALAAQQIEELPNGDLRVSYSAPFTLADGKYVPPKLRFDFHVAEAVEIVSVGPGQGLILPLPPSLCLSVLD